MFFFTFTVLTAFVVLSLFISVITMAMFEAIEARKHEKKTASQLTELSPAEKRSRMIGALSHEDSDLDKSLTSFFASGYESQRRARTLRQASAS